MRRWSIASSVRRSNGVATAKNPGSTATGAGQFIEGTWLDMITANRPDLARGKTKQEILALRTDPQLSREMTLRYAEGNRERLRDAGLPATPGNVYLSHFAGSGGARAILRANPGDDAASILSRASGGKTSRDELIKSNGFLKDMTAGELVAWADKKMGGAGVVPVSAAGGAPFTEAQIRANPFLASTWVQAQIKDEQGMVQTATRVAGAIEQGLTHGYLPNQETLAAFFQVAEQNPEKLGAKRDELVAKVLGFDEAQRALGAPSGSGAILVDEARTMAQGSSIFTQTYATALNESFERGVTALKERPWEAAHRRGWIAKPPAPLDFSNFQALEAGIVERGQMTTLIGSRTGEVQRSAFSAGDITQISTVWNSGDSDQRTALLGALGKLPDQQLEPTLRAIAKDKETGSLAFIAGMWREAPDAARAVMRGQSALAVNPKLAPESEAWAKAVETHLPLSLTAPERVEARSRIDNAVRATYAGLSARNGDASADLNDDRMEEAIKIVTGGLVEHNGSKVIPPQRGQSQAVFERILQGLTDGDFAGVTTKSGLKVTARDAPEHSSCAASPMAGMCSRPKVHPASGSTVPAPLRTADADQRFVLDLKGREPPPPASAPQFMGLSEGFGSF